MVMVIYICCIVECFVYIFLQKVSPSQGKVMPRRLMLQAYIYIIYIPGTYHLYVECGAMILESAALEELFRDDNVHETAGLAQLPVNHRRGHCLGGFLEELPENNDTRGRIRRRDYIAMLRCKINFLTKEIK